MNWIVIEDFILARKDSGKPSELAFIEVKNLSNLVSMSKKELFSKERSTKNELENKLKVGKKRVKNLFFPRAVIVIKMHRVWNYFI